MKNIPEMDLRASVKDCEKCSLLSIFSHVRCYTRFFNATCSENLLPHKLRETVPSMVGFLILGS